MYPPTRYTAGNGESLIALITPIRGENGQRVIHTRRGPHRGNRVARTGDADRPPDISQGTSPSQPFAGCCAAVDSLDF